MTKDEALKLALRALERLACLGNGVMRGNSIGNQIAIDALTAIKEALEQPEQLREENERLHVENRRLIDRIETIGVPVGVGGFATTTSQRTWVGLTDEEIEVTEALKAPPVHPDFVNCDDWMEFARAIEAKLKEKNNG
tara:strand:- start:193 stop:606 length:414 start_codon:yes stop_codon:yes gene_type:complete